MLDDAYEIGDQLDVSFPVSGSPAKVHVLLYEPDATATAFDCTASGSTWSTTLSMFDQSGAHIMRINAYEGAGDTYPKSSEVFHFKVNSDILF